jgi:hypothetical protein
MQFKNTTSSIHSASDSWRRNRIHQLSFWQLALFLLVSVRRDFQTALAFSRSTDLAIFDPTAAH